MKTHNILSVIFYYCPKDKKAYCKKWTILGNTHEIHNAIFKLQKEYSILSPFIFSTKGICPVSNELGKSLFGLLLCHFILYTNFHPNRLIITDEAKASIKKNALKLFNRNEKKQLKEIGILLIREDWKLNLKIGK